MSKKSACEASGLPDDVYLVEKDGRQRLDPNGKVYQHLSRVNKNSYLVIIEKALNEKVKRNAEAKYQNISYFEAIVRKLWILGVKGDVSAVKTLSDYRQHFGTREDGEKWLLELFYAPEMREQDDDRL